jgi:hypothetical protein
MLLLFHMIFFSFLHFVSVIYTNWKRFPSLDWKFCACFLLLFSIPFTCALVLEFWFSSLLGPHLHGIDDEKLCVELMGECIIVVVRV